MYNELSINKPVKNYNMHKLNLNNKKTIQLSKLIFILHQILSFSHIFLKS